MRNAPALAILALGVFIARPLWATEICANSIDDDGDGSTDEECAPTLTTDVCESPLSCMQTGMVSWSTGALRYELPLDIAPKVPYGPAIGFARRWVSMATPGANPISVNKAPFGDGRWQHTYLTYLYRYQGGDSVYRVILHTNDGRDVLFTYASTASGWETYTPQAGFHVMSLQRNTSSPNEYRLQLLTGEMIVYNSSGQVIEQWDNLQPTPNKVLITWDSTTDGNVSTVTDAHGKRRLLMNYSSGKLTSVNFQTYASSTWTTRHTTSYDYSISGVTKDATSGWYVPANATEWGYLLEGTGVSNPTNLWLSQETSGNLADSIGSVSLVQNNGASYNNTVTGWSRKGIGTVNGGGNSNFQTTSLGNTATTSGLLLSYITVTSTPTGEREVLGFGNAYDHRYASITTSPVYKGNIHLGSSVTGTMNPGTGVRIIVQQVDRANSRTATYTDQGEVLTPTWVNPTFGGSLLIVGDAVGSSAAARYLYTAFWNGSGAEISQTQVQTIMSRLKGGPGLTSVTIGGQLAQKMTYDASGLLTKLTDASGNQIATFAYSSTTTGQVNAISLPTGTVGFEFNSGRSGCTGGKTALYFNKASAASCSVDGDCGSGMMCGGKTGSGSTGQCFYAARCMTLSTSFNESVVTAVAPIGAGGGSCTGACTDVAAYVWNTSPSNVIRATGVQDPLGNYTSATYNANGLPTQIAYGDTNSDATDGGYQRTVFFYYDSTFPGRLAEVRRKSDLHASASSCSISSTTGCVRTLYSYDATSKQLASVSLQGTTLDTDGDPTSFTSTTTYSLDSKARVTQIDGAVSPMKTTFAYRNVSDPYEDGFLEYTRMYWGPESTDYLASTVLGYDFWGNPTGVMTPDGTVTCTTYDSARGYLSSRREAMDGQTTCVTSDDSDLVTTWTRDSALRITQLERPDESCMFWEYDTSGRLARTKRRDNCNAGSSGDKEEYLYTAEGLLYEIDTYDAGSTITRKQIMNYHASRRLAGITNPVDVTKSRTFVYDAAGMVTQVDHENSLGKTTYTLSADRRVTSESRYKDASNADTWQFLYDWLGNPSKVTDEDSKETETVRDDAGRIVKLVSPDMSYPTLRVYDAADRLTTMKQAFGGGDHEKTHTFTYDALSRPLEDNYAGACTGGTPHAEIIRSYDSTSGCPGTCSALEGRLAKVTVALLCDGNGTDGSLDQSTWYGYDDAGRNVGEYIEDDASRSASQTFAWSKNGALEQVNTPSGVEVIWGYGSAGNNSDKDRVTSMTRISTPVVEDVAWYPYGPLKSYAWEAETGGPASLSTAITRNLAYRPTFVGNGIYSGSNVLVGVTLDEDAKGRITQRVYSSDASGTSGVTDSFFLYDHQDRVTCETTTYQSSCPTSGSGLKNNLASFTDAGDWETLYRPIPGSTGFTHTFNPSGYGSSHQVTLVRQNSGSPSLGDTELGYDARGNRTYDDNTTTLTNDRRDYTYDARGNVVNVHGKFWSTTTIPNQWVEYDVASAFDARNRRVYKSFTDGTTTATWFFYYDPYDRLVEVRYTPTTSSPNTYQLFQLFWLGDRLAFYWQTDQNGGLTSRRYVATDELRRPISLWTWPDTGGTERAWAINPSAWGFDTNVAGATVFQPFLFRGQYFDSESVALTNDGTTVYRPPLAIDSSRVYDPFIGAYLQVASRTSASLFGYLYAGSNPAASAVESPDKGTDTLSDIGSLVGQHSLLPREQMAIPDGLNHTYQVFVVSFLMTGDTVCPYPDEKLRPYAERWGAQPAGEIIDLSSVLTGCQTTFHYEPLAVVCDLGCVPIRDNARCWVEAPGTQWDQHPVPLSELNIDVPGVHLGNGSHIRDCSCMCGVLVQPCCDTPHGGEDSGDEGGGHPQ